MKTVAVVAVLQLNSAGCFMIFLPQNGLAKVIFSIFAHGFGLPSLTYFEALCLSCNLET
jgi:hypothetical protein